jgi:hypothetical protein
MNMIVYYRQIWKMISVDWYVSLLSPLDLKETGGWGIYMFLKCFSNEILPLSIWFQTSSAYHSDLVFLHLQIYCCCQAEILLRVGLNTINHIKSIVKYKINLHSLRNRPELFLKLMQINYIFFNNVRILYIYIYIFIDSD